MRARPARLGAGRTLVAQGVHFFLLPAAVLVLVASPDVSFAQRVGKMNRAIFARRLLSSHLVDSASKTVESALAADSLNADLWLVKAQIHALQSDRSAELAALRRALSLRADFLQVHQALTELYCDSGLTDSASRYIALPLKMDTLNPRVAYYNGRIAEQRGQPDSAAAMYLHAYELMSASELLRVPVCPGYQIQNARLPTTGSGAVQLASGRPTLFLFWATWSPESMRAFKAVLQQLPKAAISWRFLPVNVDERKWRRSTRQRVEAKARELGYKDPVAVDSALSLFDRLNLVRIPTLVATNISGEIDNMEAGWSASVATRVAKGFFGATDSASRRPQRAQSDCERALRFLGTAWHHWESGNPIGAIGQVTRVTRACSTSVYARVLSSVWRWQCADTLRAGRSAYDAWRADSTDPWGRLVVAEIEQRRGHLDSAARAVEGALWLDSSLTAGWVLAGRIADAVGDTVKIRQAATALERLNRHDPGLYILRALLLRRSGSPAEAVALWRDILDPRI